LSPTTPRVQRLPAITHPWFGLFRFRSPLLTESLLFSLPVGTEMFHFPTFPPLTLCVQVRVTPHHWGRVSPFGHPRITARLTAPRGLSQPPTSFIGSWCQGIHRAPLQTWPQRCSRPLCSSQTTHGKPPHTPPPTPTNPHHHPKAARRRRRADVAGCRNPQPRDTPNQACVLSGPNSAPMPTTTTRPHRARRRCRDVSAFHP
jgi:hypothetical protein